MWYPPKEKGQPKLTAYIIQVEFHLHNSSTQCPSLPNVHEVGDYTATRSSGIWCKSRVSAAVIRRAFVLRYTHR